MSIVLQLTANVENIVPNIASTRTASCKFDINLCVLLKLPKCDVVDLSVTVLFVCAELN